MKISMIDKTIFKGLYNSKDNLPKKENTLDDKTSSLLRELKNDSKEEEKDKKTYEMSDEEIAKNSYTKKLVGVKSLSKKLLEEIERQNKLREIELKKLKAQSVYKKIASGSVVSEEDMRLMKKYYPNMLLKAKDIDKQRKDVELLVQNSRTKKEAQKIVDMSSKEIFEVDKDKLVSLREKLRIMIEFKEDID
ncbi:hypothetical protein HMPREF1143_0855 [Peptoanaerobacter stomatis]|uniref:Uncharacterized protein n=1 Tax=Peptoanaerobacter stomatis TaxID=796937 RepID=J6H9Z1_9FIRM|nr:hypothetical protein [Peptoanaerobacter stomatis]EJU21990.1 hypothetical protein HMPREF1143_0855 [Peptoanaerobacter stomatis]NWO24849.1 hypothetical protein [Peptostreptococcaceae bacterium oral taxon 081]